MAFQNNLVFLRICQFHFKGKNCMPGIQTDSPFVNFTINVGFTQAEISAERSSRWLHYQKKVQNLYIKNGPATGDLCA
jgi:hypothetical protein